MKAEIPSNLSIKKVLVVVVPALLIGFGIYYFTESWIYGLIAFFALILYIPFIKGYSANKSYLRYLSKFGEDYRSSYSQKIYESSIYGFVPASGRYNHCSVYADEKGIVISKKSVKRFIPWGLVVGHKIHENPKSQFIELNIGDLTSENRLVIPWGKDFSAFLPVHS